jgi:hypothetical protein
MTDIHFRDWLVRRAPTFSESLAIYGLIVMLVYGWSLYWFIWDFPSWRLYLTPNEILAMFCYIASVNLLESILVLFTTLGICIALPPKWMRDDFIWRASTIILLLLVLLIVALTGHAPISKIPRYFVVGVALFIAAHLISARTKVLRNFINELTDRATIFIYITVPMSMASLIYIIARIIWP